MENLQSLRKDLPPHLRGLPYSSDPIAHYGVQGQVLTIAVYELSANWQNAAAPGFRGVSCSASAAVQPMGQVSILYY